MARTAGSSSDITVPLVLKTAEPLFARHGYAALSMRPIAADVGFLCGALYNYIPSKPRLLLSLLHLFHPPRSS